MTSTAFAVGGLVARWIHLAAGVMAVGAFTAVLLTGRSRAVTVRAWETRLVRRAPWLLAAVLVSGIAVLAHQAALAEGRLAAAVDARALGRVLLETHGGAVWLGRHGIVLLLAALVSLPARVDDRIDWLAARGHAMLLAVAALALMAMAGHAAAVEPGTATAIAVDALHLVAAGVWIGSLLPMAALLRAAGADAGADARPYAVLAVRRFSRAALLAVLALGGTGAANAWTHVADVPGLVGTLYGRLLLAKIALFAAVLAVASVNRRRLLPRLAGEAVTVGRPAMRRLARSMTIEGVLTLAVLVIVAAMTTSPPARHLQPTWPFPVRYTWSALEGVPELATRVLVGSQLVVLGVAGLLSTLLLGRRRVIVALGAVVLTAFGVGLAVPPLAVDAYPTTYFRPLVPYHATSIARGGALYREHCAACHGTTGAGDGPAGIRLPRPPADLRSGHTGQHTAGDLFWWITHGIPRGGMPPFGERLTEEDRWDVINFVRTLAAGDVVRGLGPVVDTGGPAAVAPDFAFAVGPTPFRSLREYRGRRIVLIVLYQLPGSRARLAQLAERQEMLALLGVEVIAVPRDADPDAIRKLGDVRAFFSVVTDGAADIVETYGPFARGRHAEFLVDRQGYLRARFTVEDGAAPDVNRLLAEVQTLNAEKVTLPPADEHVH
jgi:putative copper resistance protein D